MDLRHNRIAPRRNGSERGQHGQVLILAVVALVLVIIAVLLLFDVQTVIRGKVKSQNAVDAAALTAAEWQKHSLNLIGELNLVRATGTLISDPFLARGILDDPRSNAKDFFADLPDPIQLDEFTLFPDKDSFYFYKEDGTLDKEKMAEELKKALDYVGKQKAYLASMDDLVSQLQARISFVGPLIAFGAAQQAAKNNGVTYDKGAGEGFAEYLKRVGAINDPEGGASFYEHMPVSAHGYPWYEPYKHMLVNIADFQEKQTGGTANRTETVACGIAVETKVKFARMPSLVGNPPTDISDCLGKKEFYDWIHERNWCALYRILRQDFNGNWWGNFDCELDYDFSEQSEILPLNIAFAGRSTDPYDKAFGASPDSGNEIVLARFDIKSGELFTETFNRDNPFYDLEIRRSTNETWNEERNHVDITNNYVYSIPRDRIDEDPESFLLTYYNDEDADRLYDLLPELSWATFNSKWSAFDSNFRDEWNRYLRGQFKEGLDYQSGALSLFRHQQDTVTITGTMGRDIGNSKETDAPDIGQVFATSDTNGEAWRVSGTLHGMNNINRIEADAEAMPLGRIECADGRHLRPFEAGRMILPVFTDTALIPIELESVDGFWLGPGSKRDTAWIYYLTEFVPLLSGSPSIEDAMQEAMDLYPNHVHYYGKYVGALHMLNDPEFRQQGIDWLETPVEAPDGNQYSRYEYECLGLGKPQPRTGGGGRGGGGGVDSKGGPAKLH